jgi:hypothetical protein
MACEGTALQGSRLLVQDIPVVIFCPACRAERPLNSIQLFCCPDCGTPCSEIRQGKELEVVALEIISESASQIASEPASENVSKTASENDECTPNPV